MPIAKEKFGKPGLLALFTEQQVQANLELLKQELAGMEEGACLFFSGFSIPPVKGKPAQWRAWLLATETLDDLRPECVDYTLRNLEWFKAQIAKKQEMLDDELPFY